MRYTAIIIPILLFFNSTEANQISCDAKTHTLDSYAKNSLASIVYWTTQYVMIDSDENFYPVGLIQDMKLARIHFNFNNGAPISHTFTAVDDNTVLMSRNTYTTDDEFAVFQYDDKYDTANIVRLTDKFVFTNVIHQTRMTRKKFALYYIGFNDEFFIYVTCDGKLASVQIADKVLRKFHPNKDTRQTDRSIVVTSIAHLESIIKVILDQLKVNGSVVNIRKQMTAAEFYSHFDQIDAAANFSANRARV